MRATTASRSAYYVYGVVPAGSDPLQGDVEGVAESSGVETIEHDGVAAIVSEVPLDEFGEGSLKENLNRMPWVESKVRAHERVLERALDAAPVVPLRFCTIFSSPDAVTAMLVEQEARLRGALEALAGKREWGVKAYLDERKLAATVGGDDPGEAGSEPAEGRAYFARKQRERSAAERVERTTAAGAEDVHARLGALSTASTLLPLRPGGTETPPMVLNGAYLVERERDEEFAAALAEIQRDLGGVGFTFELTGPWPPYNFVPE
jgi:hypothetical protein